ncbi:solute carrier family 17 member 9b isoform X1 [Pseudoliparis swirei]|uniref:solute carrier family 17 member 9b isoform X1 n=1 Tax=Pseudoliparis swirei TaxID=2059687 RepID=UPI0024BEF80E|nr:solute carrier family 17 member 9b isoform X1 [Pseudoliparis swirei]
MAVIQKYGKKHSPDLGCHAESRPSDKAGAPGCPKKCPERNGYWSRPEARVWTVVLLLGTCLLYCARVAMPICAVSMAEQFSWTKRESGMVLGSFFWGYCFTQVFGGYVSDRIGGEKVLLLSAAAWGSMTAFTPVLAHFCSRPIVSMTLARFLMGLLQGVYFPSLASLCSQKVVESERGFLMSTVSSGSYLGTLVIGGAGSLMLDLYGWQSIFYASGLLSVLWAYCMWKYLLRGEGKGGVVFTRAHHHPGGPGKWWRPVHAVQKALVEAPQATCSLRRDRGTPLRGEHLLHPPVMAADVLSRNFPRRQGLGVQRGPLAGGHPLLPAQRLPLGPPHQSRLRHGLGEEVNAVLLHGRVQRVHPPPVWQHHLPLGRGLRVRHHGLHHLQPQRCVCKCSRSRAFLCRIFIWSHEYVRRVLRRPPGVLLRLPHRDHRLLDVRVRPHHRRQPAGPRHLPGVRRRPPGRHRPEHGAPPQRPHLNLRAGGVSARGG